MVGTGIIQSKLHPVGTLNGHRFDDELEFIVPGHDTKRSDLEIHIEVRLYLEALHLAERFRNSLCLARVRPVLAATVGDRVGAALSRPGCCCLLHLAYTFHMPLHPLTMHVLYLSQVWDRGLTEEKLGFIDFPFQVQLAALSIGFRHELL